MQGREQKIISLVMLLFIGVFNLALPLPAQAGNDTCSMHCCHCNGAMKSCCCCKKKAHDENRSGTTCVKTSGCMDSQEEGIVCHGLSHPTLVAGDALSSLFFPGSALAHPADVFQASVYSKAIEKPPRTS